MPRHVDQRDDTLRSEREVRESEIDRDATALLLFEAIGMNSRHASTSALFPWSM
jgi:hypothetical protein